ncbi:MAG: penicillin-binding protein 1C [Desulfuromonas sp.]|nr:MAG: penicillin-binding protein 1C [Desulfuromonas sp.]
MANSRRRLNIFRRCRLPLALLLFTALALFWNALPAQLFDAPLATVIYSRDGELLGARIAADDQWRFPPVAEVPEKYAAALVEFEDRRFYTHPGVDPLAVFRALEDNLSSGRIVSGASTLSMQVIRLARRNQPRTYGEKIREMFLALRLELSHSKAEILALHAAYAPFGGNVVGLEAAAWRYFGRSADQLSWAESCMLAVLPNSPALVHPGKNREILKQKRDRLLQRLHDSGVLSAVDLKLALLEPLPLAPQPMPQLAPHLRDSLSEGEPGRFRFATTIDARLQRQAIAVVERHARQLRLKGIRNCAALIIDNRSFDVLAYIGNSGTSGDDEIIPGHAVDIVRRPRSTGSILKPLLFALMLQGGDILPTTLVPDVPTHYDGYAPLNYDQSYRGAVPAREALARSLNVPAVRMLHSYGLERFYAALKNMGLSTLFRTADGYGLTLILGGAEATLWDMAGAYANLAAGARDQLQAAEDHYRALKLLSAQDSITNVPRDYGPAAAWLTLDALVEVGRPGNDSYWRNFSSARKIAWKTGTSYGLRDGWALGNTAAYTVAVWTGNADGEGVPELTGINAAAPLMLDLFDLLPDADWFTPPYSALKQVDICSDDGYLANESCASQSQWVPKESHFEQISPYHRSVHLDPGGSWQVHSRCEEIDRIVTRDWFVLPPGQETFYRRHHPEYRTLPPFRSDCRQLAGSNDPDGPLGLLYPPAGARLYIPTDLDGQPTRIVFEAVHREPDTTLFWHLDDRFLGTTRTFHQQSLFIEPGRHTVTIVDEAGNSLKRRFEILAREGS